MNDEHIVKVNGHSFKFTWRDLIQISVVATAIVASYFAFTGRIDTNSRAIVELIKRQDIADDQRNRMDREGTRRSHEVDAMQQQMLEEHGKRLAEIEKWGPIIQKIDANVLWLMGKQLESRK